jgi:hypothetical protein
MEEETQPIPIENTEKDKENFEKSQVEFVAKKEEVVKDIEVEENKKLERNLRGVVDTFDGQSKVMLDALYERQQMGLTPLLPADKFQGLVAHMRDIKSMEGRLDAEAIEKINQNINKISMLINDVKVEPNGQPPRVGPENLEKLAIGARIFAASVEEAGRNLPIEMMDKQKEEKSKELRLSLQNLREQAQRLYIFASKLKEDFR